MDELVQAFTLMFTPGSELSQIILLTLQMAAFSTVISTAIGVPLGVLVGLYRFPGKRLIMRILNTLMGLPPVLAGLVVFFILSRSGPLGSLRLLYTLPAMVTAQVVLITPIVCGLSATAIASIAPRVHETAHGMGLARHRELLCLLFECRSQLTSILFVAFGRSIGEVGAVMLVGGNVQYKTRVMTTAIMLETNMGHFEYAIALGVALLVVSFVINSIALSLQERTTAPEAQGAYNRARGGRLGGGKR
jgi:tungstate transport system permease protein